MGLYQVGSIDNPNVVTVAVNPKEYFEVFHNKSFNKKHKGVKKATEGMNFESYASRIMDLRDYDSIDKKTKQLIQKRFQLKKFHMKMVSVKQPQFVSLNDKRYYFSDGISSLPLGHFLLNGVREKKKQYKEIHKKIREIKYNLLKDECKASSKCKRIRILRSILAQPPTYSKIDSVKRPNNKYIFIPQKLIF